MDEHRLSVALYREAVGLIDRTEGRAAVAVEKVSIVALLAAPGLDNPIAAEVQVA